MPSKPAPQVILGRKNCVKCTRWRHLSDFPVRKLKRKEGVKEILLNTCRGCRNKELNDNYHRLTEAEKKSRWVRGNARRQAKLQKVRDAENMRRELMGYKNGRLVTLTPFRMFLIKKLKVYGSKEALSRATGINHTRLTDYLNGYEWNESLACDPRPMMTIPISVVDKALSNEGSESLRTIGYG